MIFALAVIVASVLPSPCVERYLVPVVADSRPGANGSRWDSVLVLHNRSDEPLRFESDLAGVYRSVNVPDINEVPPNTTYFAMNLANDWMADEEAWVLPASIIEIRCERTGDLEKSLSIYERSGDSFAPMQLPVVGERDTYGEALALHDVPTTSEQRRTLLRIYDLRGTPVNLEVQLTVGGSVIWSREVSLERPVTGILQLQPSYVELALPRTPDHLAGRLEINAQDGEQLQLWAFASVTSADSREVRIILPAGGTGRRGECQ